MSVPAMRTCLWFDHGQARPAAEFYASVFPDTHVEQSFDAPTDYPSGQAGDQLTVEFTLLGQPFLGLNGGNAFRPNGSVSFQVYTDTQEQTDRYWDAIVGGGGVENACGWCFDRWGHAWQITPARVDEVDDQPQPRGRRPRHGSDADHAKDRHRHHRTCRRRRECMTDAPHELTITRLMQAPRAAVWQAFTDHQADWWCPKPWTAEIHVRELRPGGRAEMTMRGPNGEVFPNNGVYLDVVPAERVVFTDAFTADWQPAGPFMVGIMEFADEDGGTRYTGRARHWTPEAAEKHRAMGFEEGWGKVAEQWEEVARRIAGA